jgi:hypothetical protein
MSLFGGSRESIRSLWQVESAVASVPEGSRSFSDMSLKSGLEGWCRAPEFGEGRRTAATLILGAQVTSTCTAVCQLPASVSVGHERVMGKQSSRVLRR